MEKTELGFIYYLQHPKTGEIFYVGATETSIKSRLRTHYQHLREHERGLRKTNKRYKYLQDLRPLKAEIHLLEIVTNDYLDKREQHYIKFFRGINPNLTNMTDGGRGRYTHKYYTIEQKKITNKKISKALKGRKKPEGFAANMAITRKGLNNPASKPLKQMILGSNEYIFKYGFEINNFVGSISGYGNVLKVLNKQNKTAYGHKWTTNV